jgi:misacylated tRNA(Ala) deacylase
MREKRAEHNEFQASSTELLYVDDSYIREFDATIVRTGPSYVLLNRSAFYPRSGG